MGEKKKPGLKGVEGGSERSHCSAQACKSAEFKFSFCSEHFEQFKFGLIKKDGKPVPDYEKKFDHYMAYKSRQAGQKAA